jgi:hypothetical protein
MKLATWFALLLCFSPISFAAKRHWIGCGTADDYKDCGDATSPFAWVSVGLEGEWGKCYCAAVQGRDFPMRFND